MRHCPVKSMTASAVLESRILGAQAAVAIATYESVAERSVIREPIALALSRKSAALPECMTPEQAILQIAGSWYRSRPPHTASLQRPNWRPWLRRSSASTRSDTSLDMARARGRRIAARDVPCAATRPTDPQRQVPPRPPAMPLKPPGELEFEQHSAHHRAGRAPESRTGRRSRPASVRAAPTMRARCISVRLVGRDVALLGRARAPANRCAWPRIGSSTVR